MKKFNDLSEKEVVEGVSNLQQLIETRIKSGDKSVVLQSLNLHLKRAVTIAGNVNSDHRPESGKRNWVKSSAPKPAAELNIKPAAVVKDDEKFIEELKAKTAEQLGKMNKTSLTTIIKTLNDKEESDEKKLTYDEKATRADLGQLIFDYLNPKPAAE